MIVYTWQLDQHDILQLMTTMPPPAPLQLTDNNDHPPITFLHMTKGICYLGVYISGNQSTKWIESHLWEKVMTYMRAFQKTPMTRREAGVLY